MADNPLQTPTMPDQITPVNKEHPKLGAAEFFRDFEFSPEVLKDTIGVETDHLNPEVFLSTTKKLLDISRGTRSQDDRDSLAYQRVFSVSEYLPEHIQRDGGRVARQLLWKATNKGNLDFIPAGALEDHVSSVYNDSKLAKYLDGSSLFEALDANTQITRIGEGGVSSQRMAPDEMRELHPSFLNFIDATRSPESLRTGLDNYIAKNTRRGKDGRLYTRMINAHTNQEEWVDSSTMAKSKVATAEFAPDGVYADDNFIPIPRGEDQAISYVPRKEIDYYQSRPDEMTSVGMSMIPGYSMNREMRNLMGCLHPDTQLLVFRQASIQVIKASEYQMEPGDRMLSVDKFCHMTWKPVRGVHQLPNQYRMLRVTTRLHDSTQTRSAIVTETHKWLVQEKTGRMVLKCTSDLSVSDRIPVGLDIPTPMVYSSVELAQISSITEMEACPVVYDIDMDDNTYMLFNGLFTHNSKYFGQAVPLTVRERPLVEALDPDTGKSMNELIGDKLGVRRAEGPGTVTAVRKDRVEVTYADGKKQSYELYDNFPANQKGYVTSFPKVKAGDKVTKGSVLATTNYTDDDGVAATGVNLYGGYLSWKGTNYEDGWTISESAARDKLASTTMYEVATDLDKTMNTSKQNYLSWKPGEFDKRQLGALDDNGVIKPGTVVQPGDPIVLGMQMTAPSPGTMGKRLFSDITERWEHQHPGVVTDVVRTKKGIRANIQVTAAAEVGDKISGRMGNKGIIAAILPDDQMPTDTSGRVFDIVFPPLGLQTRTNAAQIAETILSKVAKKRGAPVKVPAFMREDMLEWAIKMAKENGVKLDDDALSPESGRRIPKVLNGYQYFYKLKHLAESKQGARGTDGYSADGVPSKGGYEGAKRLGGLESVALAGHNAFDVLKDAKLVRGQANSDFWRSIQTGDTPTMPGEPLVYQKFYNYLKGAGINVKRTPTAVKIFSLTDTGTKEMTGSREVRSADTFDAKSFMPIGGGLFGQDIFGKDWDQWAYIKLDEPLPNPMMEEPIRRLLGLTQKGLEDIVAGKAKLNGLTGGIALQKALEAVSLPNAAKEAKEAFKTASKSKKDDALKRYVAIENMNRAGVNPEEYMLTRIPVVPPKFRPITSHGGLTMVSDANYLYKQMIDARDDLRQAKDLPDEYADEARSNIYRSWKELTGLYEPSNPKLKNKKVRGLLGWALGNSSKTSAFQQKLLTSTVDTTGRAVVSPDPTLKLDQVGVPIAMAKDIYKPFVIRRMVQSGYSPVEAMEEFDKPHSDAVMAALRYAVSTRPVLLNRAPSLHKLSITALEPVLVHGKTLRVPPSIVSPFGMDFDGNCVDFDSLIFLKISKSTLENSEFGDAFKQLQKREGVAMRTIAETTVAAEVQDGFLADEVVMKIGEFPRVGTPMKDRNGADVYVVPEGVQVMACDPTTGETGYYPVSHFTVEESCHTVKVLAGGREVIVSDNESLAVFDSEAGTLVKAKPVETEKRLIPVFRKDPTGFGQFGTRDMGWWVGSFLSDGWISNPSQIGYCKEEKAKRQEFHRISRQFCPNFLYKEYTGSAEDAGKLGSSVKAHLSGADIVEFAQSFNMYNEEEKHRICVTEGDRSCLAKWLAPELLQKGSEEFLWGVLCGLIDGDGSITKNTTTGKPRFGCRISTSSKLLKDSVEMLCYKLGIRTSTTTVPPKGWSREAYIVCPSTVDMFRNITKIQCIGSRESALLSEWAGSPSVEKHDPVPLTAEEKKILQPYVNSKGDKGTYSSLSTTSRTGCCRANRDGLLRHLDFIQKELPSLYKRICAYNTMWVTIDSVEDAGDRPVFDLVVEGAKVYAVNKGIVIYDTAVAHVPVTKSAAKEAWERMRPSRNLIGIRHGKVVYPVEKEYLQGLYLATRRNQRNKSEIPVRFNSYEDAVAAYKKGQIDIDTPIEYPGSDRQKK